MKKAISFMLAVVMVLSVISVPVLGAEVIIYTTADENCSETGTWKTTTNSALQYTDPKVPSRYNSETGTLTWVPKFKQGTYKVSVYKTVHKNSLTNQVYEIVHRGKTDYATVNFTEGKNGWVELGTYDFWGDGDDYVKIDRDGKGVDVDHSHRATAISFELVELINEPIPSEKPEVLPGKKPNVQYIEEEIVTSTVVKPQKEGDVMTIPADDPFYAMLKGQWQKSEQVQGAFGGCYYVSASNSSFSYVPYMPAGTYKVEFFKSVHPTSPEKQVIEINHMDKKDTVTLNLTEGNSEWVELGTYDFWGNGNDSVYGKLEIGGEALALRTSAVRFTLLKLSKKPAPTGKLDPALANAEIDLSIPAIEKYDDGISVKIDNSLLEFDQSAILINDRTMVPLRGIFEYLGASVVWDNDTETVTAVKDNTVISLQIGNNNATKNGETMVLDVPAQLVNDRTLVPVRFVSEALGCKVDWNEEKQTVLIDSGEEQGDIYVPPVAFSELGSWRFDSMKGTSLTSGYLLGTDGTVENVEPAKATIQIKEDGDYQIFVRARDYSTNQPGTRYFEMDFNGVKLPKVFGQHGKEGFYWEKLKTLHLKEGELEISLLDTSKFYARFDGVYITKDMNMKNPPATFDAIAEVADIAGDKYQTESYYPVWATAEGTQLAKNTISSDKITIDFYTVKTYGGNVIQKEMKVGEEITTSKDNGIGALLMYADEAKYSSGNDQFPMFDITYSQNGKTVKNTEADVYKMGILSWLIPSEIEVLDEKTAVLKATNAYADATFKYELKDGETEPVVTFTFTPKKDGAYSANIISGVESKDYEYAFAPFRFNGKVLPASCTIISEPYATIPMVLKTVKNNKGKNLTMGIAVEPECVPKAWPKAETAEYGFSLRGPEGGALSSLVAPLYSSENSKMKAGESYTIKYRVIESISEWYPVYEHFTLDVYKLTDYRKNNKSTLTDAIFNTTKLANDDRAGWDDNQKGYSNIEAENLVTQSNPLVYMSTYLMTEDKDFLERRTIPTIAFLLTRPGFHYSNADIEGEAIYGGETPIGEICKNYGNAVFAGGYTMSQGLLPQLKEQGIDKGVLSIDAYGTAPKYQNLVALYNATGEQKYLDEAKKEADKFIKEQIDGPRENRFTGDYFIAINFYPQFFGLIDLYEACGEQKYIDAAVRGAKYLLPTVWIYPNSGDEDYTIDADYIRENHITKDHKFWCIKEKYRAGYPENLAKLEDRTVPFWTVSRAGLSLEQTFTYTMHDSGNMIMANWAPDLMRLAEYSGEKIFETYARNAVIGRHSTYSGYYYNNYFDYQQDVNYPFEGPDITNLYWHHIQPFLAMLQDFLFAQAWNWSDKNIYFPSVRNTGYAYFSNRMYGGEAGKFYDEEDMWLWLKEGAVNTDNVQIDWIGAKKDGVAFFGFMNEDTKEQTATVTLGDVLDGYNGEAVVYSASGEKTPVTVNSGKFNITVPARSIVSVKILSDNVKAPEYSSVKINPAMEGKQSVKAGEGETDSAHILQLSGEEYFAYVYMTELLGELDKATLNYKIGNGEWQKAEDTYAPYEFIINVEDENADFTFYVEKTKDGKTIKSSQKTLSPLTKK